MEEILKNIGQLQYEISCLELDEETLSGVTIRTDELKELVKKCSIPVVRKSSPLVEGKTKSNVKNNTQTRRLASPPPPIKK